MKIENGRTYLVRENYDVNRTEHAAWWWDLARTEDGIAMLSMTTELSNHYETWFFEIPLYKQLIANNLLNLDLVSYIPIDEEEIFKQNFEENFKKYKNNLKIGGYKIFLDGSPQGKTAWISKPYENSNNWRSSRWSNYSSKT